MRRLPSHWRCNIDRSGTFYGTRCYNIIIFILVSSFNTVIHPSVRTIDVATISYKKKSFNIKSASAELPGKYIRPITNRLITENLRV